MIKKIKQYFKQRHTGDIMHETLKRYNYRPEKGRVEFRDGGFVWVVDKKAQWQVPADETDSQI